MSAGEGLSALCAAVAFALYLVPCLADEAGRLRTWWRNVHTRVTVCRGCGTPVPRPVVTDARGVPFCTTACAAKYPHHYPEEK